MTTFANIFNPEALIIILVVVVILFGGSKIPELMKGMGQGMKEFKKGLNEHEDDELQKERLAREERERQVRERVEAEMRKEEEAKKGETLKQ